MRQQTDGDVYKCIVNATRPYPGTKGAIGSRPGGGNKTRRNVVVKLDTTNRTHHSSVTHNPVVPIGTRTALRIGRWQAERVFAKFGGVERVSPKKTCWHGSAGRRTRGQSHLQPVVQSRGPFPCNR